MRTMTIDDLRRILKAGAGERDDGSLGGEVQDSDFDDLGYDSLALMETAARIQHEYGVHTPDDRIIELRTPREVVDFVNNAIAATDRMAG